MLRYTLRLLQPKFVATTAKSFVQLCFHNFLVGYDHLIFQTDYRHHLNRTGYTQSLVTIICLKFMWLARHICIASCTCVNHWIH